MACCRATCMHGVQVAYAPTMAAMTVEQRFDAVLSAQQFMQLEPGVCFSARDSPMNWACISTPTCPRRASAARRTAAHDVTRIRQASVVRTRPA